MIGIFYENQLFALPIVWLSTGFFWVSIPGIKSSVLKWYSDCRRSKSAGGAEKETDENATKENKKSLEHFSTVEDSDESLGVGEGEATDEETN